MRQSKTCRNILAIRGQFVLSLMVRNALEPTEAKESVQPRRNQQQLFAPRRNLQLQADFEACFQHVNDIITKQTGLADLALFVEKLEPQTLQRERINSGKTEYRRKPRKALLLHMSGQPASEHKS